ncbi:MAG TPA: NADH-quinone oxidoreductase subunit A, partial [Solirubrobacteraceae bacterium]|nr:NADH-quinone oxidoreductase subunit A [Solirubrobacteraceae bacterium]
MRPAVSGAGELPLRDQLLPIGILFIIFDLEVILLVPVVLQVEAYGVHALGAVGVFILFLGVAFVYEWRRGSLD